LQPIVSRFDVERAVREEQRGQPSESQGAEKAADPEEDAAVQNGSP
jgi:hypothetical protein